MLSIPLPTLIICIKHNIFLQAQNKIIKSTFALFTTVNVCKSLFIKHISSGAVFSFFFYEKTRIISYSLLIMITLITHLSYLHKKVLFDTLCFLIESFSHISRTSMCFHLAKAFIKLQLFIVESKNEKV